MVLMLMIPLNPNTYMTSTEMPVSSAELSYTIEEIDSLEYFLEFYPSNLGHVTTNYTLEFSSYGSGIDSNTTVLVYYADPDLTYYGGDISYNMSNDITPYIIKSCNSTSLYMNVLFLGQNSELFANTTNYGSSQQFRIDEFLTFPYLDTTEYHVNQQSITKTFTFVDEILYNYSLGDDYLVQHYYNRYSFAGVCS